MRTLYLLFDETCGFCVGCWSWLVCQPAYIHLECLPSGSPRARQLFPMLAGNHKQLIAVDERGGVYRSTAAWLMCLWALVEWRAWALRFASPTLLPFAREAFELVSRNRGRLSRWLRLQGDAELALYLAKARDSGELARCELSSLGAATPR